MTMLAAPTAHATTSVRNSHPLLPDGVWALRSLLAVTFLTIGIINLWGTQSTVELFDQIGLGQWLRYLTGTLQVLGGVFVLIPLLSGIGSFILTVVMVGATLFVAVGAPGNSFLAILLLISASASFVQTQVG
jgi:putative oxidoreductase